MRLLIILLLVAFFSCNNKENSSEPVDIKDEVNTIPSETMNDTPYVIELKDTVLNDTTFIHRKITNEFYHAIYIDTSQNSKDYNWITNFDFRESESETYNNYYSSHKKEHNDDRSLKKSNLLGGWLPVYQYKEKYYLYAPSEGGAIGRRIINDSAFVYWYMDGPLPLSLTSIKKKGKGHYILKMDDFVFEKEKKETLEIYQIDPKTRLSVFFFPEEIERYRYQLYVPKENAHYFDMVVNYCNSQKQLELEFDKIDFQALLKK
jgi:hypothetical protein